MRQKSLLRTILEPLALAVALGVAVRSALHIYAIPSRSMAPTLVPGDQIVVTSYFGRAPERGHVIVFEGGDELLVKRVIALPGDLIDSRSGRLRIGGYTVAEPYVLRPASTGDIAAQVIPADAYFVLGDNRADSTDSRAWGVVPRERIVGRARMVLWSTSPSLANVAHASAPHDGRAHHVPNSRGRLFKWIQ